MSNITQAYNRLVVHGAQFVAEALKDNPEGPVQMTTTIEHTSIIYQVVLGDADLGDRGRARTVWHREVFFGMTDRTVAGGADFIAAARAQDEVAWSLVVLLRHGNDALDPKVSEMITRRPR